MRNIWAFFQNQLLGMQWLHDIIGDILARAGIDIHARTGGSLHFFLYDVIKIFTLLATLIFIVSYIQSYFPPERTKKILGNFRGIGANIAAALLGTITPFCSCSSIPLFIGFSRAGLPLGVTFSFLISSPLVDLGSLVLLMSVFGAKIALAYIFMGLVIAVAGGTIIEMAGMENYVEDFVRAGTAVDTDTPLMSMHDRARYAAEQVAATIKKVFWYVIAGVAIGAGIHNWIPERVIQTVIGEKNPFSVLLATLVGVPMYADIFGTIPIAEALFAKGVGIGTVLSFMMAVTALSLPSIILLRKAVKPKLLIVFIVIVVIGIILNGYFFNIFEYLFV